MSYTEHFLQLFAKQSEVFPSIMGQKRAKDQIKSALLMNRHMLILGPPGIGKTTLVKNIVDILPSSEKADRFVRVQGSPDLTVEDLIGDIDPIKALKFGPTSREAFQPGKIFQANEGVLFFDEVNRCSEKLQNALLQALEEGIATIGSYDIDLPTQFIFIGTLNPNDSSTEKLSDAFLDRFDIVEMNYPETLLIEKDIVLKSAQKLSVEYDEKLVDYTIAFVRRLRNPKKLVRFPSVRATIGLFERAQANAVIKGRDHVTLADISDAVKSVISHRIELKPSLKYAQSAEEFVDEQFLKYAKEEQLPPEDIENIEKNGDST